MSPDQVGGFFLFSVWIILETESKQEIRPLTHQFFNLPIHSG
jgi:hypothetical protein